MTKSSAKKLYRSHSQKVLTGVCGGLAEYFNIDVTLVRLAFVILTIFGGSGILIYIIMTIVIPVEGQAHPLHQDAVKIKRKKLFGFLAIGLGLILLTDNLMPNLWQATNSFFFPFLIIAFGCILILKKSE